MQLLVATDRRGLRHFYRLRRLATATPAAAATAAAPTTVATTLALFRFRVRPVIFPATFVAIATACPRTRATVFPAFLTVFLILDMCFSPARIVYQLRHKQGRKSPRWFPDAHGVPTSNLCAAPAAGAVLGGNTSRAASPTRRRHSNNAGPFEVTKLALVHLMRVNVSGFFTPSMVSSIASPTCRPEPSTSWPSIGPVVSANPSPTTFP
jgi:hypothetical protein